MKMDAAPNLTSYNILIDRLCKEGELEVALKVQDSTKEAGLFPNIITVNIMIDRLCKAERLDEACSTFLGLDHKVCTTESVTVCSLIDGLARHGKLNDAYMLYEKMLDSGGFSKETYNLFYEMKEQGLHLDTYAYNIVIDGFCKSGKVNKAYQLLEEMEDKGSVIDGFGKVGRIDEAYLILEELMQKGLTPKFESLTRKA
ncbi:Pentatricopeptide repeat-containing protein [Glycine soja]